MSLDLVLMVVSMNGVEARVILEKTRKWLVISFADALDLLVRSPIVPQHNDLALGKEKC